MKIPLLIKCDGCGQEDYYSISLNDRLLNINCNCGYDLSGSFDNNFTTGIRLLLRSRYEILENKDYSTSIIFSAFALEGEISKLYFKWKNIENIKRQVKITNEELGKFLRKFNTIDKKIEMVASLLYPDGLTIFVNKNMIIKDIIVNGFQSLDIQNLSVSFKKELFWLRNQILHLADVKYVLADAKKCYNIAEIGRASCRERV